MNGTNGRRAGILGTGICIPDQVVTNQDIEKMVDTCDEWIFSRTGIRERRVVGENQHTSDLAVEASRGALESAGLVPSDLDLIIVATVTPDMPFPATACLVQAQLGAPQAAAFDVETACSGFLYALTIGVQFVETGLYRHVLVIGAESLSRVTDWQERSTCILLGDGAGAVVLGPTDNGSGILSTHLGADGHGASLLHQPGGGSRHPASHETVDNRLHFIKMNGREVFRFAVKIMGDAALGALKKCNMTFDDVQYYIPHQANYRIIEASARRFGIPMDRVHVNIDRYGNTSAASVPVALHEAAIQGKIEPGDVVLLVAFGGGLTWGAAVVRWDGYPGNIETREESEDSE